MKPPSDSEPSGSEGGSVLSAPTQLLDSLAEQYLNLLLQGELPDPQEWVARYPEVADLLERRLQLVELLYYEGLENLHASERLQCDSPSPASVHNEEAHLISTVIVDPGAGSSEGGPSNVSSEDGAILHRLGFEVVSHLGAGSFGRVYRVWDRSLKRFLAVKLTRNEGSEGQALAPLEHDHIVRVFSEVLDAQRNLRVLSMQYVPGPNLATLIKALNQFPTAEWNGRAIVQVIDRHGGGRLRFDPTGPRDREFLEGCDFIEAICWIGARLAAALAHAHRHNVLHRDIKPANILLHLNGRPMLVDFNLASSRPLGESASGDMFGGTLNYMAPEHLDAYNPVDPTRSEAVDHRSDIYSLGVVLFELWTGKRPFSSAPSGSTTGVRLQAMAAERRQGPPAAQMWNPKGFAVLDRVIQRCLEPDPARRYASAEELAEVLDGCLELYRLHKNLPAPGPLTRAVQRWPQAMASTLPLVPHLLGALVACLYAGTWVASHPAGPILQSLCIKMGVWYSAIVFPITGTIAYILSRPIWNMLLALRKGEPLAEADVTSLRRQSLRKPFWGVVLSGLGWLPGAFVLPVLLVMLSPMPASGEVFLHYLLSFLIAGLIAMTYTEFIDQFLLLRIVYPSLWVDPKHPRSVARAELGPVDRRLRIFQVLSAVIPLLSAVALLVGLVFVSPEHRAAPGYQMFLVVVLLLVVLAMAGSWLSVVVSGYLSRTVATLQG